MEYLKPEDFLFATGEMSIVDVRSPGEFEAGHVTGAISIPLFADDERAIVGTIYKQQGKKGAIEKGLEIVGPKMAALAKKAEVAAPNGKLGVYCWRGGMRSNRMAWLFEQVGLNCTVLEGGYKAYRNSVLVGFSDLNNLIVLDGPTGSGKTNILHALRDAGEQILDLEGLANHKGSAFGNIGLPEQPSSQQFQNDLYYELRKLDLEKRIWIEREGMTIGRVYLPQPLWENMRGSTAISIRIPMGLRVERLVEDYGHASRTELEKSIHKLQQKLGGQHMNTALELLSEDRLAEVAELLLQYYDKQYRFSKEKYLDTKPFPVELNSNDMIKNARLFIELANKEKL
ncbi:MAG: tRNA 2-selenouridine(34) synthase MnmH [Flavobacteriales bacterium]|jgi:tRNA 2-selenouridine synthase|nr:tRNA 2-selenouridine(34) synthase MnmH [Flavobacteriales bacterium]